MNKIYIYSIFIFTILLSCNKQPVIDESTMMDGDSINEPSIANPEKYLVSAEFQSPTINQLSKPVLIAVHGYSASTWEFDELRHWADSVGYFYVSQVLLGGHGRDYASFKKASWTDWQKPIIDEYRKLDSLGYKNICLIGASTGCPLIVNMLYEGKIKNYRSPKHVYLIDPIIIPSSKLLSIVDIVGPGIGYVETNLDPGEKGHYYQYRPQESLNQLLDIITLVRKKLEDGITLPSGTDLTVYKSKKDGSADPVSALVLYKGIKQANGEHIFVEMINSNLHVFTRLQGRKTVRIKDRENQIKVFNEITVSLMN